MRSTRFFFLCCLLASAAVAQTDRWETLHSQADAAIKKGQWRQAEPLLLSALREAESLGTPDIRLLASLKDLADFYQMQGRPADSEKFLRRTIEIRESLPGLEDELARAIEDLARNLVLQARLNEAKDAAGRALAILEQKHGEKSSELLPAITLVSFINQGMSDWTAAELLMLRAISIREAAWPNSSDVAADLVNLGDFYVRRTRFAAAEPHFRRALAITEKNLGSEHASVAPLLDKLASVCRELGRSPEAEALLRRALILREKQNGPVNQEVASTLDSLGGLVYAGKRYAEAEALYARSLNIWIAVLGRDHPMIAASIDNLAVAQASQNKFDEAAANYGKSLAIRESGTILGVYYLARVLEAKGKTAEAEALYRDNKRMIDRLPETSDMLLVVLDHYASLLRKTNKVAMAEKVEAQSRLLGKKKQNSKPTDQ